MDISWKLWINTHFCPQSTFLHPNCNSKHTSAPPPHAVLNAQSTKVGGLGLRLRGGVDSCGAAADGVRSRLQKNLAWRDEVVWTKLISDKAKGGQCREALRIYMQMREAGVRPSTYTFIAALKACGSLGDLQTGEKVHAHVIELGFELQIYVASTLVNMYTKCGSMDDASGVFERMKHRNVVAWSAMILGYVHRKEGELALRFFARMQHEGIMPNARTFVGALKACSSLASQEKGEEIGGKIVKLGSLKKGRDIHSQVEQIGFNSDIFVATTLVDMYAKCGSMEDARRVFDSMPHRNVVSWNVLIMGYAQRQQGELALHLYERMQHENLAPDSKTFLGALKACTCLAAQEEGKEIDGKSLKLCSLEKGKGIHSQIAQSGFSSDIFVATTLVDMYAKCGSMEDARQVFDKMGHHNVMSWTAMILGYAQKEQGGLALQLYARMQHEGCAPDARTFVAALKACSSLATQEEGKEVHGKLVKLKALEKGQGIHSQIARIELNIDVFVATTLLDMYAKCGSIEDARQVFDNMPHRNVVSWNALILGYAQREEGELALQLYARMQHEGFTPDSRTFVGALKACCCLAAQEESKEVDGKFVKTASLEKGKGIHSQIVQSKLDSEIYVATTLVDMYAKCGSMEDALEVFDNMPHHNVVSWTAMILGYAQREGELALQFYTRMRYEGLAPDAQTFVGALNACGSVAALKNGIDIHAEICKVGLEGDMIIATALLDMYGKCGRMGDAQKLFDALHRRNLVAWNALMAGYSRQGNSEHVFNLFQRMHQEGFQPDDITFLSILTVCSRVGLVDEGWKYFQAMSTDYGITPTVDHYNCMVDLLGRAGQMDKAVALLQKMPFQPDIATWRTILSACQKWNDVEVGRHAFECLLRLDDNHAAGYVLMSNIYATTSM